MAEDSVEPPPHRDQRRIPPVGLQAPLARRSAARARAKTTCQTPSNSKKSVSRSENCRLASNGIDCAAGPNSQPRDRTVRVNISEASLDGVPYSLADAPGLKPLKSSRPVIIGRWVLIAPGGRSSWAPSSSPSAVGFWSGRGWSVPFLSPGRSSRLFRIRIANRQRGTTAPVPARRARDGRRRDGLAGAPEGEWQVVSMFLSPMDVHVNRTPVSGAVTRVEYHPGSSSRVQERGRRANEWTEVWSNRPSGPIVGGR